MMAALNLRANDSDSRCYYRYYDKFDIRSGDDACPPEMKRVNMPPPYYKRFEDERRSSSYADK